MSLYKNSCCDAAFDTCYYKTKPCNVVNFPLIIIAASKDEEACFVIFHSMLCKEKRSLSQKTYGDFKNLVSIQMHFVMAESPLTAFVKCLMEIILTSIA